MPLVVPGAVLSWTVVLLGFAVMLRDTALAPEMKPIEANLIELPAESAIFGLRGGGAAQGLPGPPSPVPVVAKPVEPPKPVATPAVAAVPPPKPVAAVHPRTHRRRTQHPPEEVASKTEASSAAHAEHPETAPSGPEGAANKLASRGPSPGTAGGGGGGGGGGIGDASTGAQAIYAPLPHLPDELRENILNTVAVARFNVAPDGTAAVSLIRPTSNPRLNYILLSTLKQWTFFPAVKDGKAVASVVDIQIPVVVR